MYVAVESNYFSVNLRTLEQYPFMDEQLISTFMDKLNEKYFGIHVDSPNSQLKPVFFFG